MRQYLTIAAIGAALLAGCIRNDIPNPEFEGTIVALKADGARTEIDPALRTATLILDEQTDIRNVEIRSIEFNDPSVKPSWNIVGRQDLRNDLKLTLATGIDRIWTIKAVQEIDRYFTIEGQIGMATIDAQNHRIVAKVSGNTDRRSLNITSFRLWPENLVTYSPDPSTIHDFSNGQELDVTCHGRTERWSIFIEQTETLVEFLKLDAWTRVAWLEAVGVAGEANGFRYRAHGDEEWTEVTRIKEDGGTFSAALEGLDPSSEYECVAYSGEDITSVETFTTEAEVQLPNSGFETFSHAESDKYYSFFDPGNALEELKTKWWCSGNKGSTTVGSSYTITKPDTEDFTEGTASLRMESQYVIIKFAAGNVFSGEFSKTIGTSGGVIHLGRPFTLRPRKVTMMLKYRCGKISEKTLGEYPENDPVKVGDNDRGTVWAALGTWDYHVYGGTPDCPVQINTTDKSTFFNPSGPDVVAYGSFVTSESIEEWTRIEIPLEYATTSVRPTHIIISCAASLLGDYFTGSSDSVLWVDDMHLEY